MSNTNTTETLSPRAAALLSESKSNESGSVLTSCRDSAALGELAAAGHKVRGVYARDTMIARMDENRDKGFDEYTIR